jgi:capsular exopolysaccharide synthesis family protein
MKKRNLVTYLYPGSIISEQYRDIQTNIKLLMNTQKKTTFLITSPTMGEGKSTIAVNLAVSMALQKEKVLLIDGNLKNPIIHSIFKIANSVGLTDVLMGKSVFENAVTPTDIGRLEVLTSGSIPSNSVQLLGSQMMRLLLDEVTLAYDMVIIDSPSVLEVTDTKLLANQCDGVILVLKHDKSKIDHAVESQKVLEYARANIIGVILNEKA